jgi:hypothetical protein
VKIVTPSEVDRILLTIPQAAQFLADSVIAPTALILLTVFVISTSSSGSAEWLFLPDVTSLDRDVTARQGVAAKWSPLPWRRSQQGDEPPEGSLVNVLV